MTMLKQKKYKRPQSSALNRAETIPRTKDIQSSIALSNTFNPETKNSSRRGPSSRQVIAIKKGNRGQESGTRLSIFYCSEKKRKETEAPASAM
jgi:hypothetical protein